MFKRLTILILFLLIALPFWPGDVFAAACSSSSAVTFSFVPSTNTFPSGSAADIVVKLNTGADDCNIAFISMDARIDAALSTYASFPTAFFSPNPAISNLSWTLGAVTSSGQHISFIALRPANPAYVVNGDLTLGTLHVMTNTPGASFNLTFDSSTEVSTTLPGSGTGGDLLRNLPSGQYTISSEPPPASAKPILTIGTPATGQVGQIPFSWQLMGNPAGGSVLGAGLRVVRANADNPGKMTCDDVVLDRWWYVSGSPTAVSPCSNSPRATEVGAGGLLTSFTSRPPLPPGTYYAAVFNKDSNGYYCSLNCDGSTVTSADSLSGFTSSLSFTVACPKGSIWDDATSACIVPDILTTQFRIAENPTDLASALWQNYADEPMTLAFEFKDKTPGPKFIWVEFKDTNGKTEKHNVQIKLLGPEPTITACFLSFEGANTVLNLKGQNFGSVKGTAKSDKTDLQVRQWKDDTIQVIWQNAPEGQVMPVSIANPDEQTGDGQCGSITKLALGARVFCRAPSGSDTANVDLTLAGAYQGGTAVKQKVTIDKEGVIQGLTQKLEAGKPYKLSVKAPRSLRKTVSFTAGEGITNIPNFILPIGDIFPLSIGDGAINGFDHNELVREWSIAASTTARAGDFNQDGKVNSIDWACMRYDFGSSDDAEATPGGPPAPSFAPSFSASSSASVPPSPTASSSASPSPGSSII